MNFLSVCSGIEAASCAFEPLGWRARALSEIDKFANHLLAHRFPETPNLGDMLNFKEWQIDPIDFLVGGTPCQSFSVAGLRKGLDDPRGNLMLTYGLIARRYRPRWLAWENVPGVLSNHGGRDFASLLGLLSGRGIEIPPGGWRNAGIVEGGAGAYGLAWRVLDAQFVRTCRHSAAVPQRRRRVFIVGYLGDWRRAAAVLFDRESLSGNPRPSRSAGQKVAGSLSSRTSAGGGLGTDFDLAGGLVPEIAPAITASGRGFERAGESRGQDCLIPEIANRDPGEQGALVAEVAPTLRAGGNRTGGHRPVGSDVDTVESLIPERANTLTARMLKGVSSDLDSGQTLVAHTLRGEGFDATEDGTGRGTPIIPVAFDCKASGKTTFSVGEVPGTMRGEGHGGGHLAVAYDLRGREGGAEFEGPHETAAIRAAEGGSSRSYLLDRYAVRRLTPLECERLQGFPDHWTQIPGWDGWRELGEDESAEEFEAAGMAIKRTRNFAWVNDPDGPRYRALGNSMAVNVMTWLGERIQLVEGLENV